jgi:ectoine hydroxylase-related dioxygenase (phytanoyl-CoA dioxygenase family)
MLFHTGGQNTTAKVRRGVNHVYTIPIIRQQIEIPTALGSSFDADAKLRRLLGYEARIARTTADYLDMRRRKAS